MITKRTRGIVAAIFFIGGLGGGGLVDHARAQEREAQPLARPSETEWRVEQVIGRVLVRTANGLSQTPAQAGHALPAGGVLVSGAAARVELESGGSVWRIGALGVWQALPDGARVLAGSALTVVPPGAEPVIEALGGRMWLGEGTWMLTAVQNEGLKVVCFSANGRVRTNRSEGVDQLDIARQLKAGELVFFRPEGQGFGPLVTIFLAESLGTSRLIHGFSRPLPNLKDLQLAAVVQNDRLAAVSKVVVAGAKDKAGFQVLVTEPPEVRKQPVGPVP